MRNTRIHRTPPAITGLYIALTTAMLAAGGWLRGEQAADDRGSDSAEKSLMIILAISVGGLVTAAAGAFIATKTALFK
jgi:hypothetical protein